MSSNHCDVAEWGTEEEGQRVSRHSEVKRGAALADRNIQSHQIDRGHRLRSRLAGALQSCINGRFKRGSNYAPRNDYCCSTTYCDTCRGQLLPRSHART